jgi:hypothetical protein
MPSNQAQPTFVVRFIGEGVAPARVPLRAVSEALAAVQDLASGRDPFETRSVPPEKEIGLVDVKKGSAQYLCVARNPTDAIKNLNQVGRWMSALNNPRAKLNSEHVVSSIHAIRDLSGIAKHMECRVEVAMFDEPKTVLFGVESGDFRKIAGRLFMKGETTVTGTVARVGGVTAMKCAMRVTGRNKLLFCNVKAKTAGETRELVRRLGTHLYEDVSATGRVVWIHRTWYIYKFTITEFAQPRLGDALEAISQLREAGLSAWDDVADPEAVIRGIRQ